MSKGKSKAGRAAASAKCASERKDSMKHTIPLAIALGLALALAGCSSPRTDVMGAAALQPPGAASQFNTTDRELVTQMALGGLYEIEVSRLAAARASSGVVRSYAQMLLDHRAAANAELAQIMQAKAYAPPAALPVDKQAKLDRLKALSGNAFDRHYVHMVGIEDHIADVSLFERGARDAADPDLKAWIARTLPRLRGHLQQAQGIAGTLAG